MPTTRTRRSRNRRDDAIPGWAHRLKEFGEVPQSGPDQHDYISWRFFGASVPGLPDEDSRAAQEMLRANKT